jgi:predicted Zn finger-like uncharacterized protein
MPEIISCPDCARQLRVPDNLIGKKVKCPGCNVMFTAAAAGPQAVVTREDYQEVRPRRREEEYDDRPRRRPRDDYGDEEYDRPRRRQYDDEYDGYREDPRRQRIGWRKVCTGINIYTIALWIWSGALVLMLLGLLLAWALETHGGDVVIQVVGILFLFCAIADLVLRTVGSGLCMAVPGKPGTGRKPLAITAFSLYATHAALLLVTFLLLITDTGVATLGNPLRMIEDLNVLLLLGWMVGLAALVVFLLANRSMAIGARARGLGGNFMALMITFVSAVAAALVFEVILRGIARSVSSVSGARAMFVLSIVFLVISVGCWIGLEIWYALTLQQLRATIEEHRAELRD